MTFKTKREAEETAQAYDKRATEWEEAAAGAGIGMPKMRCEQWAKQHRAEAARIRALLPALPE